MTELRDLLERAVVPPTSPPDLARIARGARARRRRRWAGGTATTALAAAILLSAVQVVPTGSIAPTVVGEVDAPVATVPVPSPAPHGTEPPTAADPDGSNASADPSPPAAARPEPAVSRPVDSEGRPAGGAIAPGDGGPSPEPSTAEPQRTEGCYVEQHEMAPCSYTATRPGGYESDSNGGWTITIERDGETILINGEIAPTCGRTGTIQPGDVVTVDADRRVPSGGLSYGGHRFVAAGTEYGLWCD